MPRHALTTWLALVDQARRAAGRQVLASSGAGRVGNDAAQSQHPWAAWEMTIDADLLRGSESGLPSGDADGRRAGPEARCQDRYDRADAFGDWACEALADGAGAGACPAERPASDCLVLP